MALENVDTPYSPGWWFRQMARDLHDRRLGRKGVKKYNPGQYRMERIRPGIDLLDDYYQGNPPLAAVAEEWQNFVLAFIRSGRLNIADLLVASTANRMQLRDFRTSAASDQTGDQFARDLMRASHMDDMADEVHEWMLAHADSYAIVTPADDTRDLALATSEVAHQVITVEDPLTKQTVAALKMFRDDWNSADWAYVFYYPDYDGGAITGKPSLLVVKKTGSSTITNQPFRFKPDAWTVDEERSRDLEDSEIPVFRFRNRKGVGEFEQHLGTLDRINDKVANEWWIIKMQAFRQKAVKNLPETDSDGRSITAEDWASIFVADPGALWTVPEGVDFWESQPTDVTSVTNAIRADVERLAAVTATGVHTLIPDAQNQSAQGSTNKKEENVFKIENRRKRTSNVWPRVLGAMFRLSTREGFAERGDATQIEVLWGPAERYSLTEKAEAEAKAANGLPFDARMVDIWQYPPAQVPDLKQQQASEQLTKFRAEQRAATQNVRFQQAGQQVPNPGQNGNRQPSSTAA